MRIPHLGHKEICLYTLYKEVTSRGGLEEVIAKRYWKDISNVFDFPATCTNAGFTLRVHYLKYLFPYERKYFFGLDDVVNEDHTGIGGTVRQRRSSRLQAQAEGDSGSGIRRTERMSTRTTPTPAIRTTRSRSGFRQTQEITVQGKSFLQFLRYNKRKRQEKFIPQAKFFKALCGYE